MRVQIIDACIKRHVGRAFGVILPGIPQTIGFCWSQMRMIVPHRRLLVAVAVALCGLLLESVSRLNITFIKLAVGALALWLWRQWQLMLNREKTCARRRKIPSRT